jgi:hypothetical protein
MTMFRSYFNVALRNLRKYRAYSFINIAGLALGFACCALIMLFVRDELSYDRFHPHADRLYRVALDAALGGYYANVTAIATFILLIACINFMNLSTARSAHRAKEVGMRKVLGCVRGQLVKQFLIEAVLLALLALLIAITCIDLFTPFFNRLSGKELTLGFNTNPQLILALLGVALLTGVLAGLYPALVLSSFQPVAVLKGNLRSGTKNSRLRSVLVVAQFTISIVLLVGTGVVKDFHFESMHLAVKPVALQIDPRYWRFIAVRIRPENIPATLTFLEEQWQAFEPAHPYSYFFLDEHFGRLFQNEVRQSRILGGFTMLAVIIACLGLFGLASFIAEQRTKEIGVRKVLGASAQGLVLLLSKDFTKLVGLAFPFATPVAYLAMSRWLQDFAYRKPCLRSSLCWRAYWP